MKTNIKLGILKLGKSTYFDPADWKSVGADMEAHILIKAIAPYVRELHFWGINRAGNFQFPPNFVVHPQALMLPRGDDYAELIADVERADVDAFLVINGPMGINNRAYQMFERYVYPVLRITNKAKAPWVLFYSDPRYFVKAMECSRAPAVIMCQYPLKNQVKNIGHVPTSMNYSFLDVAAIGRINNPKIEYPTNNREPILRVIGNAKPGFQTEWDEVYRPALDTAQIPWEVWGVWPEAPTGDTRYKSFGLHDHWDTLTQTLATFVIATQSSLAKGYPFTCRWYEVAASDAVTFVSRYYDSEHQRISGSNPLRCADGNELVRRFQGLITTPEWRDKIVAWQRQQFDPAHEHPDYLVGQILDHVQWAIDNPTAKAFDDSKLNPRDGLSHSEVEDDPDLYKGTAIVALEGQKMATGYRTYGLIARALSSWNGYATFDEICTLFSKDPRWNDERQADRDPVHSAARAFAVLKHRNHLRSCGELEPRNLDYGSVITGMPTYQSYDRSKHSAGAKRNRQRNEEEDEDLPQAVSPNQELVPTRTKRTSQPSLSQIKRQRRLVATTNVNPFRVGTATHTHFEGVIAAGERGLTVDELIAWIEETNSSGVQTAARLADYSFSQFPRKGCAVILTGDETLMATPTVRSTRVFIDGPNTTELGDYLNRGITGFTSNPSLARGLGVCDYMKYCRELVESSENKADVSLQVLSSDPNEICRQAWTLNQLGPRVFVKIPIINRNGQSNAPVIQHLQTHGVKITVTCVFSTEQVRNLFAVIPQLLTPTVIAVFCGRIYDCNETPQAVMHTTQELTDSMDNASSLWAGCRSVGDIKRAYGAVDIVTVPGNVFDNWQKIPNNLDEYSRMTVLEFEEIGERSQYTI